MKFDFQRWLGSQIDFGLLHLTAAANEETSRVERLLRDTRSGKGAREAGGRRYVERLRQFLHFLRHRQRAAGTSETDWITYRPTIERLVNRGDLPPEVLEQFPH